MQPSTLHHAVLYDERSALEEAIRAGLDVNASLPQRTNPPIISAASQGARRCLELLIQNGANIEVRSTSGGKTPLIIAASEGSLECVKMLLKAGANVHATTTDGAGFTALFEAVNDRTKERLEIVKLLIGAGADVNATLQPTEPESKRWGNIVMDCARRGSPAMLKELINAGADLNRRYLAGTALTLAVEENRPDNVAVLLESGADASIAKFSDCPSEFKGMTPLEIARAKRLKKIVALLEGGGKASPAKPAAVPSVPKSWKAIKRALKARDRLEEMHLNRAATAEALAQFSAQWSVTLPDDFVQSYRLHNGQASGSTTLIPPPTGNQFDGNFQLLPLDEIDAEWSNWKSLVDNGEFAGTDSAPDKGIRDDWWNPGWIPFAGDGAGDSICLDLNPAPGGRVGQVITMNHESAERRLLANSFAEWLADLAESISL